MIAFIESLPMYELIADSFVMVFGVILYFILRRKLDAQ